MLQMDMWARSVCAASSPQVTLSARLWVVRLATSHAKQVCVERFCTGLSARSPGDKNVRAFCSPSSWALIHGLRHEVGGAKP